MRKIFAQAALISGLFLIAGVGQAARNAQDTDSSFLYFKILTTEPTATLNLISSEEITQPVWHKTLPTFIDSEDYANMTGVAGLPVFEFSATYNLVDTASSKTFAVPLYMSNTFCKMNGGTEPLTFKADDWTYTVALQQEPNGNSHVICTITVTSTANEGETCTENPNQTECINQCETSNGQESWCAELCTTDPSYSWCTSGPPITQAIITIKNQVQ